MSKEQREALKDLVKANAIYECAPDRTQRKLNALAKLKEAEARFDEAFKDE